MSNFVTVEARDLRKAMKLALDIVEARNTIPILGYVRLRVGKNGFRVIATDLDIEAMIHVDTIDRSDALDICIDAKRLHEIAAAAGVMPMKITEGDGDATISLDDGAATYTIRTLPSVDFPSFDWKRTQEIEGFSNGQLAALLNKVKFCISTEETRYYLNGVAWQIGKTGRHFVSTDGHKLAACRYSKEGDEGGITRIIPRKTVGIITKHLAGKDVKIFATERASAIDIASPGMMIRTKLIDGTFPDWARVVPHSKEFTLKLKRSEIVTAIVQATAIGSDRVRGVKFEGDKSGLVVEHHAVEFGKARVKTSVAWPDKAPSFGFNHQYFRLIAANCDDEIELDFNCAASPFVFRDADETMTRVLMPMRV